jgi:hypothetical protein
LLRDADADMAAVRVRVQNADRWVLRFGNRSLTRDFVRIEDGGISIGAVPESIFRDAVKLHWLANFHQWRVIDRAMFNFVRLASHENGLPEPRLILVAGGRRPRVGLAGELGRRYQYSVCHTVHYLPIHPSACQSRCAEDLPSL